MCGTGVVGFFVAGHFYTIVTEGPFGLFERLFKEKEKIYFDIIVAKGSCGLFERLFKKKSFYFYILVAEGPFGLFFFRKKPVAGKR